VTDDPIPRDMFYNGRMKYEKAAVVLRLAPTWFRFGSFEILARNQEFEELRQLVDFVLKDRFPHALEARDGIHQSFLVPSIFLLSFLPAPNSSAVYLVARAWKFLPTLSKSPILLSFFQEILVRNLVCSLG
jgi:hypothetical protein